jgi:hypothetical protein
MLILFSFYFLLFIWGKEDFLLRNLGPNALRTEPQLEEQNECKFRTSPQPHTFPSSKTRANPNQTTTTLYLVLLVPLHALPSLPYCYSELDVCVSIEIRESTFVLHEESSQSYGISWFNLCRCISIDTRFDLISYQSSQIVLASSKYSYPPCQVFFPFRVMDCFIGLWHLTLTNCKSH